jgi:hypothetical protein
LEDEAMAPVDIKQYDTVAVAHADLRQYDELLFHNDGEDENG